MKLGMNHVYIECQCEDASHVLRFTLDNEDGTLYVETHLTNAVWYKRIWIAIKYVFGKKSRFGEFSETILDPDDYNKIIALMKSSGTIQNKEIQTFPSVIFDSPF